MLTSILSTKLYIPKMRSGSIIRKVLVEKIACGIDRNNSITLVSAPAGYGKTTLVTELVYYMNIKRAWVSLDEGDNDLVRFLSYIIAALKGVGIKSDAEKLLSDLSLSSNHSITTMVINDIEAFLEKVILVLDDFHLVSSAQTYEAVKFLVEHQPSNLHIIFITREDPRLPLARLRALGQLTEIRIDDLRFKRDEVEEFLRTTMGLSIEPEAIDAFNVKTEGWAAGLQLAGLSLRGCEKQHINEFISEFNGTHRYIIDYLVEEVLQHQRGEIRDFLCKTSVLHSMNGAICDALIGRNNSRAVLQEFEQENLFIIPLDGKREWYRYHHLFQDSLRAELTKEEEQLLHKRAAKWLAESGYKMEAVRHGFESGDMQLTVGLIIDSTEEMFASAQLHTLVKWIEALPDELVRGSEILCIRKAWALLITGRLNHAVEYLDSLGESFMKGTSPHNRGLALSLRAIISQYTGQGNSEELAAEALGLLEEWDPISRISTLNTLGRAQENRGNTKEAGNTFRMAYLEGQKLGYTFITTLALLNLGTSIIASGKRKEAVELYLKYIDGMTAEYGKPLSFIGVIYISLAGCCYEGNDLEGAVNYINKGIELCNSISYNWSQSSEVLYGRIQYAMGNKSEAIEMIQKSVNGLADEKQPVVLLKNISALVEMLFRNEEGERAAVYEQMLKAYICVPDSIFVEEVYFAYIRILIYNKNFSEAFELLARAEGETESRQKLRALIKVNILYAMACYEAMDYNNSSLYMGKALELAEPHEYYRLFLDEEPFIADAVFLGIKGETGFKTKLLDYINLTKKKDEGTKDICIQNQNARRAAMEQEYIEKLSQREIDILKLLGDGLSNGEISKRLYISINTTQWHISHVYSKLNVKNRTQAIIKARELGIM